MSVNCTAADVVAKSATIAGSAGRYMSMVSGPTAISEPRTSTSLSRWLRLIRSPGVGVGVASVVWGTSRPVACGRAEEGAALTP